MLNDAELRMLTGEPNLLRAANAIRRIGPSIAVAKRGEYGAALFTAESFFAVPGFLLEDVRDPTGAGDSFAGGFLGYLDGAGSETPTEEELRRAMVVGSVMASFNVEDFGTEGVCRLNPAGIDERLAAFKRRTHFEPAPAAAAARASG
jgi:sugar/nucleoside kinase (ribokinase family)